MSGKGAVNAARLAATGLVFAAGMQTCATAAGWPPGLEFFPILPWDPQHGWSEPWSDRTQGLESIAECGFTMAGFVRPEDIPECERLGLKAIMFPDVPNVGTWSREWHKLTDEEIDERVIAFVEQSGTGDAIMGYYIQDEPSAAHFAGLAKAVNAIRKYAPGKLAYINLYPDYATVGAPDTSQLGTPTYAEYLERYVAEVKPQFISYDNYMTQVSLDMTDPGRSRSYYENLLDVRRVALDSGLPFWNIVSSNQIRPATTVPSPANLLLQAYTTLAAGGRGVSWYTYYSRSYAYAPIGPDGNRTPTWSYLQMVNRQLRAVGPVMNSLKPTGVFFTDEDPPGELPRLARRHAGRLCPAVRALPRVRRLAAPRRREQPADQPVLQEEPRTRRRGVQERPLADRRPGPVAEIREVNRRRLT